MSADRGDDDENAERPDRGRRGRRHRGRVRRRWRARFAEFVADASIEAVFMAIVSWLWRGLWGLLRGLLP